MVQHMTDPVGVIIHRFCVFTFIMHIIILRTKKVRMMQIMPSYIERNRYYLIQS